MITSLVTGGAGFIGSHVVKHLLTMGHKVIVLDDLSGGFMANLPPKAVFIKGSAADNAMIERLFSHYKFTYVYHLAAYAAEGLSHFIRRFNYANNLMASVNLINASVKANVRCFVFASSIAVYGTNVLPMVETATPKPEDPYGIAKYAVELDLKAAHEMFGLNYIIFRPHNVYGEHQNIGDKYRNVIGIFMNQLLQSKPLTIYGDGQQSRAFTYIDDVAPHIARSVMLEQAYNEVFNIGSDTQHTVTELAVLVMEAMQKYSNVNYLLARKEVVHAYANHNKLYQVFNIQAKNIVPLKTGLNRMANWVYQEGARTSPVFKHIEITKNLPANWQLHHE